MKRTRATRTLLATLALLAMSALAACGAFAEGTRSGDPASQSESTPTPETEPVVTVDPGDSASPEPTSQPVSAEPPAEALRVRDLYRPLETIDAGKGSKELTIAGYYLKDSVLHVYLLDGADREAVRAEVEAALGDKAPSGGIRLSRLESPPDGRQLNKWIGEAKPVIHSTEGVQIHSASGGCCNIWDRVRVSVGTVYSAHLLREALEQTSVPQEAVFIEVSPRGTLGGLEGEPVAPNGVRISIDAPAEAAQAEAVDLDVVLTNTGHESASITYNPYLPKVVTAFNRDGEEVWSSYDGGAVPLPAKTEDLAPGEELRFTATWALDDMDGSALPPGEYILKATSTFNRDIVSEPHTLEVTR